MPKRSVRSLAESGLRGRRVLVRVDYNVPLEDGKISDDTRIEATLPTLELLRAAGARIILVSHLGRPKGSRDPALSLRPVAARLSELIGAPVAFVDDVAGTTAASAVEALGDGELLLLENVRFEPGEKANDPDLAERLASFADEYVNDAFGTAHRAHASTVGVAKAIRAKGGAAVAGLLMESELRHLGDALESPERPFVAILGGAKISGKIEVIESLLPRVDRLLIGGAMANTFFRALGLEMGTSLVEEDRVEMARALLGRGEAVIVLPVDCVVAEAAKADAETRVVERDAVPPDAMILDIGPASVALFAEEIGPSRTIVWNGPMGVFELEPFLAGTIGVARAVAEATAAGATSVLGGGDTAAAAERAGIEDDVTHVSTGGGASLEFMEGKTLPGVAALDDAKVAA